MSRKLNRKKPTKLLQSHINAIANADNTEENMFSSIDTIVQNINNGKRYSSLRFTVKEFLRYNNFILTSQYHIHQWEKLINALRL